jgi:hypothetical protein
MKEFFKALMNNERVFKNLATSLLGVAVLAAYFGLLYSEKSSATELTAVLTLATMLLRVKDSVLGIKK